MEMAEQKYASNEIVCEGAAANTTANGGTESTTIATAQAGALQVH